MCDVAKYSKMYKDIKNLQPEDTLQLVLELSLIHISEPTRPY